MTIDEDKIAKTSAKLEAKLQATLDNMRDGKHEAPTPPEPPSPSQLDLAGERKIYADLLDFIQAHKDPDTIIEAAEPDDYVNGLD